MTKAELVKSLLSFTQAAILALIDAKVSAAEASDLILRGTALVAALKAALQKD